MAGTGEWSELQVSKNRHPTDRLWRKPLIAAESTNDREVKEEKRTGNSSVMIDTSWLLNN